MSIQPGTEEIPLRVAVVGAGPAGFFAADALMKNPTPVKVDLFEALPAPYGLVRYGVAPDHQQLKKVTAKYDRTAQHEDFSYFGNVRLGQDITIEELRTWYDAVILSVGTPSHRSLGIPGEDLPGVYPAEHFINWFNGYPGCHNRDFEIDQPTAVIIGNGNVALDAARILAKSHDELKPTDITQHSLDKLIHSRIKDVHIVGRRSAVQASLTHQEIAELQKLQDCDVVVDPVDMELDENGRQELEADERIQNRRFWSIFEAFSRERKQGMNRRLIFRFLRSPVAFEGDGKVERVVFQKNRLEGEPGRRKARGTGETEVVEAGLVITCVGYRGAPIPGVPFHDAWGVVPNEQGRVMENDRAVPGLYVSGWIKRGPSGVIGTNKACSVETVTSLLADLDRLTPCEKRNSDDLRQDLLRRGLNVIDFIDWKKIDAEEVSRGEAVGKPREKMVLVDEMLSVAGGS